MRPHIYIATENVTFIVDDRVRLVCKIENTRLFIAARDDEKSEILFYDFLFEIDKVSTKDKGIYKCVANFSGYGQVVVWYELQVRGTEMGLQLHISPSRLRPFLRL